MQFRVCKKTHLLFPTLQRRTRQFLNDDAFLQVTPGKHYNRRGCCCRRSLLRTRHLAQRARLPQSPKTWKKNVWWRWKRVCAGYLNVNNKSRKSTAHWRTKERKKLDDYNTRIQDKSFKAAAAGKNKQNVITSSNSSSAKNKQRNCLALPMQ